MGIYAFYVLIVVLFFNTPLFEKVTSMDDPELTQIRFAGAISPFPGYLWIHQAKIYIRDQNVSSEIHANQDLIKFDLLPFFKKKVHTTLLQIGEANVKIGFKTPEEKEAHLKKYTSSKDVNSELKKEAGLENLKNHIHLEFPNIHILKITEVDAPWGDLKGEIHLEGGFTIQPGAEVEVFPTTLTIHDGTIPNQFEKMDATVYTYFERFFIPDAPGNAVFPFITADVHFQAHILLHKGNLTEGSFLETSPSRIALGNSNFRAYGTGEAKWKVVNDYSTLDLNLAKVSAKKLDSNPKILNLGTLSHLDLHLDLYGNALLDAFHGLMGQLTLKDLKWSSQNSPKLSGQGTGQGKLIGFSGNIPKSARKFWNTQKTNLQFEIEKLTLQTELFKQIEVAGSISAVTSPIDLGSEALHFPTVKTHFKVKLGEKSETTLSGEMKEATYLFSPLEHWKGNFNLVVADTRPFVEALQAQKKIAWPASSLAKVSNLNVDLDWELGNDFSWFRFNRVKSSGIWTAYGSLMDSGNGLKGAFEVRVAGMPVGIRLEHQESKVKILPSKDWYTQP